MKQKNLLIIVILAVVLGGLWFFLQTTEDRPTRTGNGDALAIGEKLLPDLPVNDVAKFSITENDETVILERGEKEWSVGERAGYPADFQAISRFLTKIWGLEVTQKATVRPENFGDLNLDPTAEGDDAPPKPMIITFTGKDGQSLGRLLVGKEHFAGGGNEEMRMPNGRFVAVGENPQNAYVISDTLDRASADPITWLNDQFLKVREITSVKVDRPGDDAAADWSVSREDPQADFTLAGDTPEGQELDTNKLNRLKNLFGNLNFDDVKPLAEVNQEELFANATTATIQTANDFTYTVRIGEPTEEGNHPFYVTLEADLPETAAQPAETEEPQPAEGEDQGEEPTDADEDAKAEAEAEEKKLVELKEQLAREQRFAEWVYFVPDFAVNALTQDRSALFTQPEPAEGQAPAAGGAPGEVVIPGAEGATNLDPGVREFTAPAGQPLQIPVEVNTDTGEITLKEDQPQQTPPATEQPATEQP